MGVRCGEEVSTCIYWCRGNCELAIDRMKSVAERGPWSTMMQDSLQEVSPPPPSSSLPPPFYK